MVEYASLALRLSFVNATSEARMMVAPAAHASHGVAASSLSRSIPKM